ncbi:ABC transporter substrate-binding protein [Polaromonas glacialis]|uniref:ABC transporter substrate-binding protein n=1 Tax=Polaromonas glacialis TaxID=866564 RepID=UPI0004974B33|nr:ABC transporter substrate-binding protein [Polaromonas glacialis]
MPLPPSLIKRRQWLQRAGWLTAGATAPGWAQPGKAASAANSLVVAQLVDFSGAQQDVSKDFLIGSRAAWQDINARGGIRGRQVMHLALETDGTAASVRTALNEALANPACLVLSGSVGDPLASQIATLSRQGGLNIAHAAPWLQNASLELDDKTFPIFAARQEQIAHALNTLTVMGVKVLGAVYASAREHAAYHLEVERIAASMQLQLQSFQGSGDVRLLGQKLTSGTPAVLLFVGGTPELAQFTQGLEKQARQRYIVALADVNLQTLLQMGAARNTPVIATQPVPMVNSALSVVRQYRETLARLFDEAPTPLSLAGFIAARYTFEVLNAVDGGLTRQSVLAGFQQRASLNIGGFRVAFNNQRRSGGYVTQSMMTLDGRLIG